MAKGIIYCMTTIVPGLIKIGKTGSDNFESRMYHLEHNGYCNVVGLKRHFAIEVEDYSEKEQLLDEIFSKSNVPGTELFALDINLVVQLLSSLEGKQIYPLNLSKEDVFDDATDVRSIDKLPDGEYYLKKNPKRTNKKFLATMKVENGLIVLCKGSGIVPREIIDLNENCAKLRQNAKIVDDVLQEDIICSSPSTAASIVNGHRSNGWNEWKTKSGKAINNFRMNDTDENEIEK